MSKFKVGDEAKVIGTNSMLNSEIKIGDIRVVTNICLNGVELDSIGGGWIHDYDVELVKPKWTIYNNTLPWSDLSDKQKGKMLLAQLEGVSIRLVAKSMCGEDCFIHCEEIDTIETVVYRAKPAPVKPEPTMAELFIDDWKECSSSSSEAFAGKMIAKGWVKKC
ncbi:MAG: hypothetical protein ACJASL_000164 [Paraglaciecola sp.]|jgi:hypothetical protein